MEGWKIPACRGSEVCFTLTGLYGSPENSFPWVSWVKVALMMASLIQAVISFCINWSDSNELYRSSSDVTTLIYGTSIVTVFGFNNGRLYDLVLLLNHGLFKYSIPPSKNQIQERRKAAAAIKLADRFLFGLTIFSIFLFSFTPMLFGILRYYKGSPVNRLPFPLSLWYPVHIDSFSIYLILYSSVLVVYLCMVMCHLSWQSLLISSILSLQGEIRILALALTDVENTAKKTAHQRWVADPVSGTRKMYEKRYMILCLQECIQHHQKIISCVSSINTAFKTILFSYLQCCTFIFCMNATRIALTIHYDSLAIVTCLGHTVPVLVQFGLLCWFGQRLKNESQRLHLACYQNHWIHRKFSLKSTILIMMARCNRGLRLSAVLYAVDIKAYSKILQAAYSYINFLMSVHDRTK